jgi:hypothetical protein
MCVNVEIYEGYHDAFVVLFNLWQQLQNWQILKILKSWVKKINLIKNPSLTAKKQYLESKTEN